MGDGPKASCLSRKASWLTYKSQQPNRVRGALPTTNFQMIRNSTLLIGYGLLAQLRIHAEIHGTGCAENSAELILSDALNREPAIADKVARRITAKKQADKEWEEKWGDNIPMRQLEEQA